ncbi:MAG TPA: hypothetical protein VF725_15450 [Ktedonobacterales bacterium]
MRTVTRIGLTLSVVAVLALYGLQLVAGLGVIVGIIAIGALAGLAVAKWLERGWYGRQLEAGARAGAIACGVAGLASAAYLLGQRPAGIEALAARSRLPGISLAPLVHALSPLGVAGADIASVVVATLVGVALAAVLAQVFGWGKDKRSQRVIAQARLAAQAQQHEELGAQTTPTGARSPSPSVQLFGRQSSATNGPAPASSAGSRRVRRTAGPDTEAETPDAPRTFESWGDTAVSPAISPAAPSPKKRDSSHARSADDAITAEERAALLAWEAALEAESEPGAPRKPNASAFLNEQNAAPPRRNRKKQNTRDWLC